MEEKNESYIALSKSFFDDNIHNQKMSEPMFFLKIIMEASEIEEKIHMDCGKKIKIKRGEYVLQPKNILSKIGWTRDELSDFLKKDYVDFEKIIYKSRNVGYLLKIKDFDNIIKEEEYNNCSFKNIYRSFFIDNIWTGYRYNIADAFFYLLKEAQLNQYVLKKQYYSNIILKRGELFLTTINVSEKFLWNRKTVVAFLEVLEKNGMIETVEVFKDSQKCGTIVKIQNFDSFIIPYSEQIKQEIVRFDDFFATNNICKIEENNYTVVDNKVKNENILNNNRDCIINNITINTTSIDNNKTKNFVKNDIIENCKKLSNHYLDNFRKYFGEYTEKGAMKDKHIIRQSQLEKFKNEKIEDIMESIDKYFIKAKNSNNFDKKFLISLNNIIKDSFFENIIEENELEYYEKIENNKKELSEAIKDFLNNKKEKYKEYFSKVKDVDEHIDDLLKYENICIFDLPLNDDEKTKLFFKRAHDIMINGLKTEKELFKKVTEKIQKGLEIDEKIFFKSDRDIKDFVLEYRKYVKKEYWDYFVDFKIKNNDIKTKIKDFINDYKVS